MVDCAEYGMVDVTIIAYDGNNNVKHQMIVSPNLSRNNICMEYLKGYPGHDIEAVIFAHQSKVELIEPGEFESLKQGEPNG